MSRPATSPHFRSSHPRRAEEGASRKHRKATESEQYKDQLLCELELQRTVMAERIRSLEKTRDELEHRHESLAAFYTESPIGYLTISPAGQILNANEAATALFGMEAARLNQLPFGLVAHQKDIPIFLKHLAQCKQSGRKSVTTELRLRNPVDDPLRVQLVSVPTGPANRRVFLTAIVDISDRVRNQRRLAEAQEFPESIVDTVSQPLAVVDSELRIISVNRAFAEFFKRTAEFARGRVLDVILNLWWSGNALRTELEKVLVKDQPLERFQIETEVRGVGKRTLLLNARRLYRTQGPHPLILIAMEDITLRKQAEEQLRALNQELESRVAARTEALKKSYEQMESFCYSIAHDLRAPLRSMTGFSRILLDDCGPQLDERGRDYTMRIHESAQRMDRLIGDLLNFGRLNTVGLEIQDVNLEETFRSVLLNLDLEIKNRRAKISKKMALPRVRGHPTVLQSVLINLISNAMKFVAPDVQPVVSIWCEERGAFSRIWVEDNGIGITAKDQAKIFGVFERLHSNDRYPGTGIGLAIVHKGIERLGGRVGVESQLNKGSRFWIELRRAERGSGNSVQSV
jgi:PAS domain S-box-containing protein